MTMLDRILVVLPLTWLDAAALVLLAAVWAGYQRCSDHSETARPRLGGGDMKGFSGARRSALVLAGAFILAAGAAGGQTGWRPDKPIEIIVPTAAGGSNDVIARVVQKIVQGEKLAAVPVNAVNRVGGNQTLSRVYLNQHPGDAHFLHVDNPTVISNHITGITPMHHSDSSPIALLISEYTVFTVRPDSPLRNARDLVEQLKQDPESVGVGVSNRGGTNQRSTGVLAGVPTLREQGYDISLANWRAMSGPRGLSPAQIAYWEDTLAKVVATDEWKKALEAQYWAPSFLRSREFAKYLDNEYAVTKAILGELGLVK